MNRICVVGAGNISHIHLDALRQLPAQQVVAVVDVNLASAQRLAMTVGATAFASVDDALIADRDGRTPFDRAHVLVPPNLHAATALPLLSAGKAVLIEKPLAATIDEVDQLLAAAQASGAAIGINQNFVHHPAFVRLRRMIDARTLGRPTWVGCVYNVPLRQLAARQFGHWMFREPGNILLEQAVHPLSQIVTLSGPIEATTAMAGPAHEISRGVPFVETIDVLLRGSRLPAQMRFAVGQNYPFWQVTVVCDDGVITADILANRVFTYRRTRWLPAVDEMLSGLGTSLDLAKDSVGDLVAYGLSTTKLKARNDAFYRSMLGSISAFHSALDAKQIPELDGAFGADLVRLCETIRDQALPTATPSPARTVQNEGPADVAILGGTGFIGAKVVKRFLDAGQRVSVMARSTTNLSAVFDDPRVTVHRGDIRDMDAIGRSIGSAPIVINLAHGGGGADFAAIKAAMLGGAAVVADACQAAGAKRLIHVGSIASLYLGPQPQPVTDSTPPDAQPAERGDYAHAKILTDQMLLDRHARQALPVVILRPGIVVGEGSSPFHSGVGLFNNEQHCIGWNAGTNELPFVLVEEVADAIFKASTAPGIEGRTFNIVGNVRMTARDYIATLGQALHRPLRYHPQSARWLWMEDSGKWLVKRVTGRKVAAPSVRDFLSRGMRAQFDTSAAQEQLGWTSTHDRALFIDRAIRVHASNG